MVVASYVYSVFVSLVIPRDPSGGLTGKAASVETL